MQRIGAQLLAITTTVSVVSVTFFLPFVANAQVPSTCPEANTECDTVKTLGTPCECTVPGGVIAGTCTMINTCTATPASWLSLSNVLQYGMIGMMGLSAITTLSSLFGNGNKNSSGSVGGTPGTGSGCLSYYQTSVPSSDPCAIYSPNSSTLPNNMPSLNPNGSGSNCSQPQCPIGTTPQQTGTGANSCPEWSCITPSDNGSTNPPVNVDNSGTTISSTPGTNVIQLPDNSTSGNQAPQSAPAEGLTGNIVPTQSGATIFASNRDSNSNTQVSGFFGGGGPAASVVGHLCQSRPWANSFLSYIIPASFFDSLCSLGGYPVGPQQASGGNTAPQQNQVVQSGPVPQPNMASTTQNAPDAPPAAVITVSPSAISIGQRATVYWSSKNVTACDESSSDGNFSGHSLSGGAYTEPITGAVTFTITCRALDGSPVTDSKTVGIGI